MSSAPDYAEALEGWRTWRVVETRRGVRLSSVLYDDVWEPRVAFAATCSGGHRAPCSHCACGVYGVRSPDEAARYLIGRNDPGVLQRVIGVVRLWGVVFEGGDGWRAETAYPQKLHVPWTPYADDVARALEAYGVPIEVATAVAA